MLKSRKASRLEIFINIGFNSYWLYIPNSISIFLPKTSRANAENSKHLHFRNTIFDYATSSNTLVFMVPARYINIPVIAARKILWGIVY